MKIRIITVLAIFIVSSLFVSAYMAPDGNKLVKTEFISEYSTIKSGMKFKIGIIITAEKHWHTYWMNPGDAGLPTTIDFQLPKGVKIGEPIWETPEKIPFAGMANYGYEGSNLLTFPVEIADDFAESVLKINADVRWLVCKEECIPGSRKIAFEIPVADIAEVNEKNALLFLESEKKHYMKNDDINYSIKKSGDEEIILEIQLPEYLQNVKILEFYPFGQSSFDNGANQNFKITDNNATLNLKYDKYRDSDPQEVHGILVSDVALFEKLPNRAVIIKIEIK